jgi:hypothetical protein
VAKELELFLKVKVLVVVTKKVRLKYMKLVILFASFERFKESRFV